MKTFTITIYSDPGHAWGKVKRRVITMLGLSDKITSYSYAYKDNVYLEEDCDLPLLIKALQNTGHTLVFNYKTAYKDSRIRQYDRYTN